MQDRFLTPADAWADFLEYWKTSGHHIHNDIATATRDLAGRRKNPDGIPYRVGANRIWRLLEKYSPGRYRRVEGFLLLHA